MSAELTAFCWKLERIDKLAKLVLVKIGDNYNEADGYAWPSVSYLAAHTNMSERQVQRVISDFIKSGVLVIVGNPKGGRRTREYKIDVFKAADVHGVIDWKPSERHARRTAKAGETDPDPVDKGEENPVDNSEKSQPDCQSASENEDLRGDTQSPQGRQGDTPGVTGGHPRGDCQSPKTLREPLGEPLPKSAPARARDPTATPADAFELVDAPVNNSGVDACTVWKEAYNDLVADFGFGVYQEWLALCIPESDVDGVLTLAVATNFYRDHIKTRFVEALEKTLGRKVLIVQRTWAGNANWAKQHKRLVAEEAAERQRPSGYQR